MTIHPQQLKVARKSWNYAGRTLWILEMLEKEDPDENSRPSTRRWSDQERVVGGGWGKGRRRPHPTRALAGRYSNNTGKHREINMASVALFCSLACPSGERLLLSRSLSLFLYFLPRSFSRGCWGPCTVSLPASLGRVNPLWGGVTPGQSPTTRTREESARRAHVRC